MACLARRPDHDIEGRDAEEELRTSLGMIYEQALSLEPSDDAFRRPRLSEEGAHVSKQ